MCRFNSELSIILHWATYVSQWQYHTVLIPALQADSLLCEPPGKPFDYHRFMLTCEIRKCWSNKFVVHFQDLTIWSILQFHTAFKVGFFISSIKLLEYGNCDESVLWIWVTSTYLCLIAQSCLNLCDPMDYSLPISYVQEGSLGKSTEVGCQALLQVILPTQVSWIAGKFFTIWATREACLFY